MIRGITIGFGGNLRLLAGDVCPRGWSERSTMGATPFGQPSLSPESRGLCIGPPLKTERSVCETLRLGAVLIVAATLIRGSRIAGRASGGLEKSPGGYAARAPIHPQAPLSEE